MAGNRLFPTETGGDHSGQGRRAANGSALRAHSWPSAPPPQLRAGVITAAAVTMTVHRAAASLWAKHAPAQIAAARRARMACGGLGRSISDAIDTAEPPRGTSAAVGVSESPQQPQCPALVLGHCLASTGAALCVALDPFLTTPCAQVVSAAV